MRTRRHLAIWKVITPSLPSSPPLSISLFSFNYSQGAVKFLQRERNESRQPLRTALGDTQLAKSEAALPSSRVKTLPRHVFI